jgi:hypothetical protein
MNTSKLPGFTAESALAGSEIAYRHDANSRDFLARRGDSLRPAMNDLDRGCARLWGLCMRGNQLACTYAMAGCSDWLDNL